MMDWCERFGFRFDPFFDKPLESESEMRKWLVVEKKMEEQMTPLIRQMSHVPFLSLIAGDRGVGKSTFMYYSMRLAEKSNFLPVYVGLDHIGLESSRRPTYDTTEALMYGFGARLLDAILSLKSNFFSDKKGLLLNLARYLGLDYQDSEGFLPSGKPYRARADFFELKRNALTILNLMKKAEIPTLLAIDNLDRVTKIETLKDFFMAPFAQSFFDDLKKGGVSILIAMGIPFSRIIERTPRLKYITQAIDVTPLSPPQAAELLEKRIRYSNDPPPRNPFETDAMLSIGILKKGITRNILTEARTLCLRAHEEKLTSISKEFVDHGLVSFDESRAFYEIIDKRENLRASAITLCKIATNPNIDPKQAVSAIRKVVAGKNIVVSDELLKVLIDSGIIRSSLREKYILTDSTSALLESVKKIGWNVNRFFDWILAKDTIRVLTDEIPGADARSSINEFGPIPSAMKATVDIIVGNTEQTIQTRTLHQEAVSELTEAKRIMNEIGKLTWDDIDNVTVFKKTHRAIVAFLSSFSRLYISCATSRKIRLKSFRAGDLIENSIHHFQEEYGVSFKSFHRFQRLRANMNGLIRGGFSPSHSDIRAVFDDFKEIVIEFTNIWQGISHSFSAFEIVDERHQSILREVSKIAQLMGYSIERPEYRRFKIDGEKYYKLGFSEFPLDQTTIDLVSEKRTKNRLGEVQSYFLFSCVRPDTRNKAKVKEILTFIHKCNDLIDIIDRRNAEAPVGWPRYLLLYVSVSGYESGIRAAVKSTIRSEKSEIQILDYQRLMTLKRQLTPARKIPMELPKELDELWTKDLEQLLRLRIKAKEVIHEKFEKTTTIILADMKDFTRRTMRDKLESAEAVQKLSDILEQNVKAYNGIGTNTEGDSFIAALDKPELAALAALESIRELEQYNRKVKEENRIYVRIGICTGDVIFKSGGRPFIGNAANIAARIMKEAEPNRVVTTEETYKQISALRNFEFKNLGLKRFKGIDKPLTIFEIRLREPPEA